MNLLSTLVEAAWRYLYRIPEFKETRGIVSVHDLYVNNHHTSRAQETAQSETCYLDALFREDIQQISQALENTFGQQFSVRFHKYGCFSAYVLAGEKGDVNAVYTVHALPDLLTEERDRVAHPTYDKRCIRSLDVYAFDLTKDHVVEILKGALRSHHFELPESIREQSIYVKYPAHKNTRIHGISAFDFERVYMPDSPCVQAEALRYYYAYRPRK